MRGNTTIAFQKKFAYVPSIFVSGCDWTGGYNYSAAIGAVSRTTVNFNIAQPTENGPHWSSANWYACGKAG